MKSKNEIKRKQGVKMTTHQGDKDLITSTEKQNYQLTQEYDKLKTENEWLKKQVNDLLNKSEIQDKILWKIDNEALLGSKDVWIYKLEQTLIEIKWIAENMNKECFYDDFDCMNCDMQNGCTYFNKKQILQKISECGVQNEHR